MKNKKTKLKSVKLPAAAHRKLAIIARRHRPPLSLQQTIQWLMTFVS